MVMISPRLKLALVLGENKKSLGIGKITLLKAIQREHSLSKAAKSINMSYRRAWLLIQELNESLLEPVLITHTGGPSGGGSELTAVAIRIIAIYEQVTIEAEVATKGTRHELASMLKHSD